MASRPVTRAAWRQPGPKGRTLRRALLPIPCLLAVALGGPAAWGAPPDARTGTPRGPEALPREPEAWFLLPFDAPAGVGHADG